MTILSWACSRFPGAIFSAVALIVPPAVGMILPASAQTPSVQKYGEPDKVKSQSDISAEKEAEKAYQRSLGNIPAQKDSDPWGTVRSDGAPPKAAKATTVKPKAKPTDAKTADTKPGSTAKQ